MALTYGCTGSDDELTPQEKENALALKAALRDIKEAREFVELFPSNHSGVYFHAKANKRPDLQITAFPYDRYELSLTMKMEYDSKAAKAKAAGNPEFHLNEIERIEPFGPTIRVSYTNDRVFGPDQWDLIYQKRGDFSAVGFAVVTNSPINGIDKLKARDLESPF